MGCGASAVPVEVKSGAEAELPKDTGEEVPDAGKVPITSRPEGCEGLPAVVVSDEVLQLLDPVNNPPQITPVTKAPLKPGIWVKPSPKCIMPVVFHYEDSSTEEIGTTIVEMKEFDSPDDVFKNWTPQVDLSEIEGVVGLWPIAPGTVLSGLAPNRYMFRWNHGGARTCGPKEGINLIAKITEYLTSFMDKAQDMAKEAADMAMAAAKDAADKAQEGGAGGDAPAVPMPDMPDIPMPSMEEIEEMIKKLLEAFKGLIENAKAMAMDAVDEAGEALPDLIPDDCYILGDIGEAMMKFKEDLLAWSQIKSPRELPDWLGPIKTLFIEFEDNYIYNLIEIKADVHLSLGYFQQKGDEWKNSLSMKEKLIVYVLDKAPEKAEQALQLIKDNSLQLMQAGADKISEKLSIDLNTVAPTLMPSITGRVDKMTMSLAGLSKDVTATTRQWDIDRPSQLSWMLSDRDEAERKKRIEDVYYTVASKEKGSGVSRVAHVVPDYFYEVEIYIVMKKGVENTFKRAYLQIWQEDSTPADARKMLMKPYYQGTKPEAEEEGEAGEEEGEEEEGEEEEGEEEEEEEEGEEEEEEEEEEEDSDEIPYMFRGFHITAPVLPGRNYCYGIIIDKKVYINQKKSKKKVNKFCKKFKLEVGCADWGVNPLRELGLI